MKNLKLIFFGGLILFVVMALTSFNSIPAKEEFVFAAKGQMMNQYKRRNDLIPQLVNTVKGAANFEKKLIEDVIKARQQVVKIDASSADLQQYMDGQNKLGSALSRLLVTVERYPEVKAIGNFATLQAQLEGTENRIAVARRDYISAIRSFNITVKTLPGALWNMAWYQRDIMQQFTQPESVQEPVQVNFDGIGSNE